MSHNLCHNFILLGIEAVELAHTVEVVLREPLCLGEGGPEVQAHLIYDSTAPDARAQNLADVVPEVPIEPTEQRAPSSLLVWPSRDGGRRSQLQHGRIDLQMRLDLALAVAPLHALNPLLILRITTHRRIARNELIRNPFLVHC